MSFICMVYCPMSGRLRNRLVAAVGADEEDAARALLEYEVQEGAGSVELGFFI